MGVSLKIAVFWVAVPCSLVEDYMAQQPKRQPSSLLPLLSFLKLLLLMVMLVICDKDQYSEPLQIIFKYVYDIASQMILSMETFWHKRILVESHTEQKIVDIKETKKREVFYSMQNRETKGIMVLTSFSC
jgi:hypothetical protein